MNNIAKNSAKEESLISIIIPVYNSSSTIDRCIRSVANQNIFNNATDYKYLSLVEIIVIDDGSIDDSVKVVRELFGEIDSEQIVCKLIKQTNQGPSSARNSGIKVATGEWLYFLDSDDTIVPECLSELIKVSENFYEKHQTYPDIVLPRVLTIENNIPYKYSFSEKIFEYFEYLEIAKLISLTIQDDEWKCRYPLFYSWGKMIRTSLIKDNHILFDESISHAEDAKFGADMIKYVKDICVIDKPLYNYYFSKSSLSTADRNAIQSLRVRKQIGKSLIQTFSKWNVYDEAPEINIFVIKLLEIFLIDSIRQNNIDYEETKSEIKKLFNDDYFQNINIKTKPKLFYDRASKLIMRLKLSKCCEIFIRLCRKFNLLRD